MDAALAAEGLTVAGAGTSGGSSIWLRAEGRDTGPLAARLQEKGVLIEPGAPFFATATGALSQGGPATEFYRLAYSSIPVGRIGDGVALVAQG
jgi:GntR family transcriptional regulator/MocR family aminotransferase